VRRIAGRFSGIFFKLMLSCLGILLLSYLLFALLSAAMFRNNLWGGLQDNFFHAQSRIVEVVRMATERGWDRQTMQAVLDLWAGPRDTVHLLYDGQGNLLYRVGRPGGRHEAVEVPADIVEKAVSGQRIRMEMEAEEGNRMIFAGPVSVPGAQERAVVTVFFGFERNFHLFLHPNLFSLLIAVPLAAIVYYFFSARLTRRLKAMNRTALKFAKGDFRERLEVRTNDEIGQLGRSLNYMADELASLEDMRRAFLANVSHDMRSPIASIKGFVSAMLDGTIAPEREKHYLKMVKDSAERMLKLVEDLLDIARIDSGQFTIERVRFNLTERIRQTAARMEPLFKQYQIGIHMEDLGEDAYVRADPDRIDQVMTNLLQNAVYHSPPGSEVRVSVTRTSGAVTVSVADSGSGMTEEELSRMWDRFYKGDKARSKKTGTGIGLSIVKHILDLHGSEVQAESSPGKGTTVRFTLTDL